MNSHYPCFQGVRILRGDGTSCAVSVGVRTPNAYTASESYEYSSVGACPPPTAAPTAAPTSNSACGGCNRTQGTCLYFSGSCSAFQTDSECWDGDGCFATSSSHCCDPDHLAVSAFILLKPHKPFALQIAGLIIGIIAVIVCIPALSIALCCFCCTSCPWAKSRANGHCQEIQQPHGQPVVVVASNQPPPSMQTVQPINKKPEYLPQSAEPVLQT